MAKRVAIRKPPRGFSRFFYRFPILFYKWGWGGLFGKRMLLLNHTGRKSGLPRKAVLEVVNLDPETNTFIINVGFGPKTDWYQNLLAQPNASIMVGKEMIEVHAASIKGEAGGNFLLGYSQQHPKGAKMISKLLGYEVDGTHEDWRALGEQLIFVQLSPR